MKTSLHLLIIDDDADDIQLFTEAVAEIDSTITCTIAKDGLVGMEILNAGDGSLPDLIFLDLRMPRMGGRNFLSLIKEDALFRDIPVIIYTTSSEVEESIALKGMGAMRFISKPTDPEEIYYLVSVALEEMQEISTRLHS